MKPSKQALFSYFFRQRFIEIKNKFKRGDYSWSEEITRKEARILARAKAREDIADHILAEQEKLAEQPTDLTTSESVVSS